ncbi:MAG: hypothetical protein VX519_10125 [Myxococcota bacterium]|nr:hypothetical protein [Myxococcota bacterium]
MDRPRFDSFHAGLHTDFYQLVLSAVYHADGLWGEATFDLYPRNVPDDYGYLVAGGVVEATDAALDLSFSDEDVEWLQSQEAFSNIARGWWESLRHFRFTGDIWSVPEGTVLFQNEPILRVTAPLAQASLLETRLVQAVSHGTGVATRASRVARIAGERRVYEFGSRMQPGAEAALRAARAAFVGGVAGTSCSLAGSLYEIPVMGTLSETYMAAYDDDPAALEAFRVHFPKVGFVALPSGDLVEGARALAPFKDDIRIVRVDHDDLGKVLPGVREALDSAGLAHVKILGSGSLDEQRLFDLVESNTPADFFGVGRHVAVGTGGSRVSLAYRLAEIYRGGSWEFVRRPGASAYPGRKQVVRGPRGDAICLESEAAGFEEQGGSLLLQPVVLRGERVAAVDDVQVSAARCATQLDALPPEVLRHVSPDPWPLQVSDGLAVAARG